MEQSAFRKIIVLLNGLVIAWALLASPPGDPLYHFQEHHLVTYYSAFQLAWLALLCFLIYDTANFRPSSLSQFPGKSLETHPHYIWLLMALGFLWLSFDELLMLHEQLDHIFHQIYQQKENAWSDRIDDLIVLGYFLIAVFLFYRYRQSFANYRNLIIGYLKIIIPCTIIMIALDLLTNRNDLITHPILFKQLSLGEEIFKLIIEVYLLLLVYGCWKQTLGQRLNDTN